MEFKVSALCKGCGACVRDCGFGVLAMKDGRPVVREGREEQCMNCQHCLAVCPEGAVTSAARPGICAESSALSMPNRIIKTPLYKAADRK